MAIAQFKRITLITGIIAFSLLLVGQRAFADDDDGVKIRRVNCAESDASIQEEVDEVKNGRPTTIVIKGTCTEEVTVRKDDLTLLAHAHGGTVDGSIDVIGAQRVTIDGLTVAGGGNAVSARDNASVTIRDAIIVSDGGTAVLATRSTSLVMENTTVDATGGFACAAFIGDGSVLRMNGGNTLSNSAPSFNCATLAVYRNSTARIRGSDNTITNNDPVTGGPNSGSAGGFALDVEMVSSLRIDGSGAATIHGNVESFNLSTVDLRKVVVNGGIYADGLTANVRLRGNNQDDVIVNGDVFPGGDSAVNIRNSGQVIINGNIDCSNGDTVRQNFAHFGNPPPGGTDGYVNCFFSP